MVLSVPPYHCELNPINLVWCQVKGSIACQDISFKLADVEALDPAALQQVFPENWSSYAHRAVKVEERMWADGGLADITMNRLIIKTGEDGSTDDSDDEDMGCKALVEWWLNHRVSQHSKTCCR